MGWLRIIWGAEVTVSLLDWMGLGGRMPAGAWMRGGFRAPGSQGRLEGRAGSPEGLQSRPRVINLILSEDPLGSAGEAGEEAAVSLTVAFPHMDGG